MTKTTPNRLLSEVQQRAVRMVLDHGDNHVSHEALIGLIAAKSGRRSEALRGWVRQAERDQGLQPGLTNAEGEGQTGALCPQTSEIKSLWRVELATLKLFRCCRAYGLSGMAEHNAWKPQISTSDGPSSIHAARGRTGAGRQQAFGWAPKRLLAARRFLL